MHIVRKPRAVDGFTLVELLVVVLILAILTSVALPLYNQTVQDASQRAARANMQTIATAEQAYRLRNPNLAFTYNLADLAEVKSISGPGDRVYTILQPGASCVANPYETTAKNGTVPAQGFGVTTTTTDGKHPDGCYIPGVSKE